MISIWFPPNFTKGTWWFPGVSRMPDSFMMFVFVTCILFTFVSWSGLFINRAVAPARVTIAVIPAARIRDRLRRPV